MSVVDWLDRIVIPIWIARYHGYGFLRHWKWSDICIRHSSLFCPLTSQWTLNVVRVLRILCERLRTRAALFTQYEANEERLALTWLEIILDSTMSALTSTRTHIQRTMDGKKYEEATATTTRMCEPKPSHLNGAACQWCSVACLLCFVREGSGTEWMCACKRDATTSSADGKFSFMKMASQIRLCIFRWLHFILPSLSIAPTHPFALPWSSTVTWSHFSPWGCQQWWRTHFCTIRHSNGHVIFTLRHPAQITQQQRLA